MSEVRKAYKFYRRQLKEEHPALFERYSDWLESYDL